MRILKVTKGYPNQTKVVMPRTDPEKLYGVTLGLGHRVDVTKGSASYLSYCDVTHRGHLNSSAFIITRTLSSEFVSVLFAHELIPLFSRKIFALVYFSCLRNLTNISRASDRHGNRVMSQ